METTPAEDAGAADEGHGGMPAGDLEPAGRAGAGANPADPKDREGDAGTLPVRVLACDHAGQGWAERRDELAAFGMQLEVTRSLRETVDRLGESPRPELLLVDPLSGGGRVELAALESRRRDPLGGEAPIPVLMVVGNEGEEPMLRAHQALPSGHWDLLRRDAGGRELELKARRLVDQARAADEMQDLRHRAFHDDRTDLLRPLAFQARLLEHFSAAQRHGHDIALVLIDLDRFGQINKLHDHTVGDAIIALVGEVVRETLRAEDVAGRLGGDEFAVLLPYTRKLDAAHVVNRLREEIRKLSGRPGGARQPVVVSASIGFETFDGHDVDSLETLRDHAERALRASKVEGGDRATYFRSLPQARADGPKA